MKVGVIMGGISSEREVSLNTGKEIVENLDREKYEVIPIVLNNKKELFDKVKDIDFAFIALHGKFGEDGTIQTLLEAYEIPYSGCGSLGSSICMNKDITKRLLKSEGITTADWTMVRSVEEIDEDKIEALGYPLFIKPNNGGSSVATFKVTNLEELLHGVKEVLKYDKEVIIESYVQGDEYTVGILNGETLPIILIKSQGEFYDYNAKYLSSGTIKEMVVLPEELEQKLKDTALRVWKVLNCEIYGRVDIIMKDGKPYVLELNTLPGMTPTSLLPKSAKKAGIEFPQLLDRIIDYSLYNAKF